MGLTADCTVEHNGEILEGKALLETNEVIFRGARRFHVPFESIKKLEVIDDKLVVSANNEVFTFHLGAASVKWAAKIQNPPTLLDKLGCKPGLKFKTVGTFEDEFLSQLDSAGMVKASRSVDILFFSLASTGELTKFETLTSAIKPTGAIWVVYPKGVRTIKESEVMSAGKDVGLVDVKVAGFSSTLTAIKMMIPIRDRK